MSNTELLKQLRELTQAGMKDCKEALEASEWDIEKAVDFVKAKGLQNTSSREGKTAAEGMVVIINTGKKSTLIELNSQTDFVAKSPAFKELAQLVCSTIHNAKPEEKLYADNYSLLKTSSGKTLDELRKDLMATTKENIVIRRWSELQVYGENRSIAHYTHNNDKIGVVASMEAPSKEAISSPDFVRFAEDVAMQVAAMNPLVVARSEINEEDIERQKAIFETQLRDAKKPEAAWGKIIDGKFNKWYSEVCLLEQDSVVSPKNSISKLADELSKKLCGEAGRVLIRGFTRFQAGEGIETSETDYVGEISKLTGVE